MNCEQFQTMVGAEPKTNDPDAIAHAAECSACATYRAEMQRMDRLIHRALSVPAQRTSAAGARASQRPRWALAASVLLSVGLALSVWLLGTRESLAEQAIEHVEHEAFAMTRTQERVAAQELRTELAKHGLKLKREDAPISYAMTCPFRGRAIGHLVVQTQAGPATVLVLPNERSPRAAQQLQQDGYDGVVVPAPRGVLVVLGQDIDPQAVANQFLEFVEYDT